jgi:hypothetical protein
MLIVLLTWYVSAELIDGYRLVNKRRKAPRSGRCS